MNRMRIFALSIALLRGMTSLVHVRAGETATLDHWKESVRARFPGVAQLSTSELASWLADTNRVPPLLLDVRTKPEFALSHLPAAHQVDPGTGAAAVRARVPTNRPIVVYCSVGWRSSELATRLAKAGITNVFNLEGSIFAWANEHRPLEAAEGQPVTRVHPYNSTFGRLLRPEVRGKP